MTQYLGKVLIRTGGVLLETEKNAKLTLGGNKRTALALPNGQVGYYEEFTPAHIDCTMDLAAGASLDSLRNMTDADVTFACDTGQTYVIASAFTTEVMTITGGEGGKINLKMSGSPAEEVQ